MSRTGWKKTERDAAALLGATRFHANTGARMDFEGPQWVGQAKSVQRLSLATLEALTLEMERLAFQKGKLGAVVVKRSAGRGVPTPHLVIVSEATWRAMTQPEAALPQREGEGT